MDDTAIVYRLSSIVIKNEMVSLPGALQPRARVKRIAQAIAHEINAEHG
jgi:hypothetical protein